MKQLAIMILALPSLASGQDAYRMVSLGDSITTAFNASGWFNNKSLNWSSGDRDPGDVDSHYFRLERSLGMEIDSKNYAKFGAKAEDLEKQVEKVGTGVDYVTLLIGANDVCDWPVAHEASLVQFKQRVEAAVQTILAGNPEAKILLSAIPDVHSLYDVGRAKGCEAKWQQFRICKPLLDSSLSDEDRWGFRERWLDANEALADVATTFQGNITWVHEVAMGTFDERHITSKDCFHPSIEGQRYLSEITWDAAWR